VRTAASCKPADRRRRRP